MDSLDLLHQPLLSIRFPGGERAQVSLPEVLASLGAGEELEFSALRQHQRHGWHAFLVQLAALVASRSGDARLDHSAEEWRGALLDLAGEGGAEAWCLVVGDLSRPAFLQTPVPEGSLAAYHNSWAEPDSLDVVITAKNHDVKQHLIARPRPEHWIYALLTLQTMEGFLGRGNYGIARMNGGFASRPALAAAPGLGNAERFRRDVAVWLEARPGLVGEDYPYPATGGHALLWTLPWNGKSSRPLSVCDPFFIEVCRRVRILRRPDGSLEARAGSTKAAFLEAKQLRGDTGDVWTPVKADNQGSLALTVPGSGFSYRLMTDLLFSQDYRRRPALEVRPEDGARPVVVAQVLVRGQGKTDGYHQRLLPLPEKVRQRMGSMAERDALGEMARARVERAAQAERLVLKPALCSLLQGGPDQLNFKDRRTGRWTDRMDSQVDAVFFDDLWAAAEEEPGEADRRWDVRLLELARAQLEDAVQSAPVPLALQPRAVARAELLFRGLARKHLPGAFPAPTAPEGGESP